MNYPYEIIRVSVTSCVSPMINIVIFDVSLIKRRNQRKLDRLMIFFIQLSTPSFPLIIIFDRGWIIADLILFWISLAKVPEKIGLKPIFLQ
jgi:hypothetical protein